MTHTPCVRHLRPIANVNIIFSSRVFVLKSHTESLVLGGNDFTCAKLILHSQCHCSTVAMWQVLATATGVLLVLSDVSCSCHSLQYASVVSPALTQFYYLNCFLPLSSPLDFLFLFSCQVTKEKTLTVYFAAKGWQCKY